MPIPIFTSINRVLKFWIIKPQLQNIEIQILKHPLQCKLHSTKEGVPISSVSVDFLQMICIEAGLLAVENNAFHLINN